MVTLTVSLPFQEATKVRPAALMKRISQSILRASYVSLIILLVIALGVGPAVADPGPSSSSRPSAGTPNGASANAGSSGQPHGNQGKARLAPDLVEQIRGRSSADRIRLVATLNGFNSQEVESHILALGGEVKGRYPSVHQMVFEVPAGSVASLTESSSLDYITPDRPVDALASHLEATTGASLVYPLLPVGPRIAFTGYDGSGIGVAVIDSGIDAEHFDLRGGGQRRTVASVDFVGRGPSNDPYGHGTHVAGIIAGNGSSSSQLPRGYAGIAPGASLLNLRVLDESGHGYLSGVIAAIDFAIANRQEYNIRILNLSLAAPPVESYRDDPLCQAVERATLAGLVVVTAAGNFGVDPNGNKVYGGITSPGTSPAAITVGATNTHGTDARSDDTVARYSSRGPTRSRSVDPETGAIVYDDLAKPDLVAPGVRVVSLERYQNQIVLHHPEVHVYTGNPREGRYMLLSGTSMAAPVVSGAVALMLQANPSLTPNLVKTILMYTSQMMDGPDLFEQGAGLVNIDGAVRVARALSTRSGSLLPGQKLTFQRLPLPQSTIAGETVPWNQGILWGDGWLSGSALLTQQQMAYAQTLIWGFRDLAWGTGVTWYGGLYSDDYVVYGKAGQWVYVQWDDGGPAPGGCLYRPAVSASGIPWQPGLIDDSFFSLDPATLIWGYSRYSYDLTLIWGRADDASLIWGGAAGDASLIWGYGAFDLGLIWGSYAD